MSDTHGFLNVHKPRGLTSFQVVSSVRSLTRIKRVGHAGTLDAPASGVLPIALGQANRLIEYLHEIPKTYRARIQFGLTTDTYDATGQALTKGDPTLVTLEQVQEKLAGFIGAIWQAPPPYSAVHYQGKRLHTLARAGVDVTVAPRQVSIYRLETTSWDPPVLGLEVECGKGTYIRSLAHDLGRALGCGACLIDLERVRYGPFLRKESVDLEQLRTACEEGWWSELVYAGDEVLLSWQAMIMDSDKEKTIRQGKPLAWNDSEHESRRCRAYGLSGYLVAVLTYEKQDGQWRPEKVLNLTPSFVE
ncbi:MAG: tRNA pseudouridine(55) synthase TruB [Chloroflexi bacterium]|nr:tRNA pseudouridine(55) synthase TruB [Chloroflexota bacterium]